MSCDETRILKTMRAMAWERAKGELRSILNTYLGEQETFEQMNSMVENFCSEVDSSGLVG